MLQAVNSGPLASFHPRACVETPLLVCGQHTNEMCVPGQAKQERSSTEST